MLTIHCKNSKYNQFLGVEYTFAGINDALGKKEHQGKGGAAQKAAGLG